MREKFIFLVLPLFVFFHPPDAKGEGEPSDFFPKDFTTNQGTTPKKRNEKPKSKPSQGRLSRSDSAGSSAAKDAINILRPGLNDPAVTADAIRQSSTNSFLNSATSVAIPLKSIGVILNSSDNDHFLKHLKSIIVIATKYNLSISRVYAVGNIPRINADENKFDYSVEMLKFWILDGLIVPAEGIPKEYDVEQSPTWIFTTSEGEILVEGILSPEKLLNAKGNFVGEHFRSISTEFTDKIEKPGVKNGK